MRSVFWDLYCAAPERRETCDHSSEAKAFHDYVSSACEGNSCSDQFLLEKIVEIMLFQFMLHGNLHFLYLLPCQYVRIPDKPSAFN